MGHSNRAHRLLDVLFAGDSCQRVGEVVRAADHRQVLVVRHNPTGIRFLKFKKQSSCNASIPDPASRATDINFDRHVDVGLERAGALDDLDASKFVDRCQAEIPIA